MGGRLFGGQILVGMLLFFRGKLSDRQLLAAFPVLLIAAADRKYIVAVKFDGHLDFHRLASKHFRMKKDVACSDYWERLYHIRPVLSI